MEIKSEQDFKRFAEGYYDNPQCFAFTEFEQDLKRFSHVAKLIEKYNIGTGSQERLILNNIIIIHNLFGRFTVNGLFYKTDRSKWVVLKTFLGFLKYIPVESVYYTIEDNLLLNAVLDDL